MAALRSLTLPFGKSTGTRLNLDGVKGAIFVYNEDGHLIATIAGQAGTSPEGRDYEPGLTAYPPDEPSLRSRTSIRLGTNGELSFFAPPSESALTNDGVISGRDPGDFYTASGASMTIAPPSRVPGQLQLFMRNASPDGSESYYASLYPSGADAAEMDAFRLAVSGAIVPQRKVGSFYENETWHLLTPAPGWVLSANVPGRYRRLSTGMVQLDGVVQQNSGVPPAGTVITTLPAGYRPGKTVIMPLCFDSAAQHGRLVIDTAGAVSIWEAPNALPFLSNISFAVAGLE